jgi:hypothetical protein
MPSSSAAKTGTLPLDSARLWTLANKIEEKQLWAGFLSEQEHVLYRTALLRGRDAWDAFLEGRIDHVGEQEQETNGTALVKTGEKAPDGLATAFRVRNMLFDCYIRRLFPARTGDDLMDFELDVRDTGTLTKPLEEKPKTREIEEDNYDDEEEEEEPSAPTNGLSQSTDPIGISVPREILP